MFTGRCLSSLRLPRRHFIGFYGYSFNCRDVFLSRYHLRVFLHDCGFVPGVLLMDSLHRRIRKGTEGLFGSFHISTRDALHSKVTAQELLRRRSQCE